MPSIWAWVSRPPKGARRTYAKNVVTFIGYLLVMLDESPSRISTDC